MKHLNQFVIVTGGGSGIGAAIAHRFKQEGAKVAIFEIDLSQSSLPDVDLKISCNVADLHSIESAFEQIREKWGRIDVLINNAGISIREPFEQLTLKNWNQTLAVNLTGPFLVSQKAISLMKRGVIINIASVSGMVGMPNYLSYNVSKAGVIEMTKTLALELAPHIRVNAICPGYILTPMQRREYTPKQIEECASKLPIKRLGTPEEIGALASYLASSDASYATGQSFILDGGETAGGLASI